MGHGSFRPPLEREEGERGGVRRRKGEGRDAKKGGGAVCWGFLIAGMDGGGCTIIGHAGTTHLAKAATAAVQCSAVRCVVWAGGSVGWAGGESVCVCVCVCMGAGRERAGRPVDRSDLVDARASKARQQARGSSQASSLKHLPSSGRQERGEGGGGECDCGCLPACGAHAAPVV